MVRGLGKRNYARLGNKNTNQTAQLRLCYVWPPDDLRHSRNNMQGCLYADSCYFNYRFYLLALSAYVHFEKLAVAAAVLLLTVNSIP